MNIAILHYHLNRGGVTRVIANHLQALDALSPSDEPIRAAIFFGGRDAGWPHDLADWLKSIRLSLHAVDALDYNDRPVAEGEALADLLRRKLTELGFHPEDTILHVHNHSLGKNASWPGALRRLAADGFAQLLQIHDFAEDFRPQNYRLLCDAFGRDRVPVELYPHAEHIHYAVLNRRDQTILQHAGVPRDRLHFLPNSAPSLGDLPDRDAARLKLHERLGVSPDVRFALYPVRGIRRKNIGEAVLWSLLAGEGTWVGITLAPINPAEQKFYERWKQVADDVDAPIGFGTGESGALTFEENLAAADLMVTTSVAEGFGMVFLESWLAGKTLTGRNLPEITVDFVDAGMEFPHLYDRLEIPVDWIGRDRFSDALQIGLSTVLRSFGLSRIARPDWDGIVSQKIQHDCIDFADLNEELQEEVVRRVAVDPAARGELLELNRTISNASADARLIDRNRRLVESHYSLHASGERLHDVYRNLLGARKGGSVTALPAAGEILDRFLDPVRYRMIRG